MTLDRSMDSFGPEDMQIPQLRLIQNVGGDWAKTCGARPGDFFMPLSDEVIKGEEGLDIVLVDIKKIRTYWGRTEIEDSPPTCMSMDAGSTLAPGLSTDGKECVSCEFRSDTPWLLDSADRREKCLVDYNLICINMKDATPFIFRASGISSGPVKELFTNLKMNKELKGEYHRAVTHVTSLKKKTSVGEAYAIHFSKPTLLDAETAKKTLKQTQEILGGAFSLEPEQTTPIIEETGAAKEPVVTEVIPTEVTTGAPPAQNAPTKEQAPLPIKVPELDTNF